MSSTFPPGMWVPMHDLLTTASESHEMILRANCGAAEQCFFLCFFFGRFLTLAGQYCSLASLLVLSKLFPAFRNRQKKNTAAELPILHDLVSSLAPLKEFPCTD